MGFSFSGMMRGLGAGLVSSGSILQDKAKRDWEEQQLMLKLEREEHLKRLELQANKEAADRSYNLQKLGIEGQTAYQQKSLENQGLQLTIARENQAQDASYRSQMAANAAEEMRMKREAYDAAKPEAQMKMRETQAKYLEDLGVPKQAIGVYIATGDMPDLGKTGIKVDGGHVEARLKTAEEQYALLDDDQKAELSKAYGTKGDLETREAYKKDAVADLFVGQQGTSTSPKETPDLGVELDKAKSGDAVAFANVETWINKHNKDPKDPMYFTAVEAAKELSAAQQSKPKSSTATEEKGPGFLSRTLDAVKGFSQRNVDTDATYAAKEKMKLTQLDALAARRYGVGKKFESLSKSQQNALLNSLGK